MMHTMMLMMYTMMVMMHTIMLINNEIHDSYVISISHLVFQYSIENFESKLKPCINNKVALSHTCATLICSVGAMSSI